MRKDGLEIESLSQIKKVEVSPFLFTRIQQRINEATSNKFSGKVSLSLTFALVAIVILNIVVLQNYSMPQNSESNFVQNMNIITNNSIYNE